MTQSLKQKNLIRNLLAIFVVCIHSVPFYILLTVSTKPRGDASSRWIFSPDSTLENFSYAFEKADLWTAIENTLVISVVSVILIVIVGILTAYPLARVASRVTRGVRGFVVAVMMVPPLTVLVPLYKLMISMGAVNTYWGIILVTTTYNLPLAIFMYTNFIASVPVALEEAARIDGCSNYGILFRIVLPLLKPVTASVVIMTGVGIWNDYAFQLYFLQRPAMRTVTLAIASFFTENASNMNAAAAAALLVVIVPVVIYLAMQKYFVQGALDSAVK